MGSSAVHFRVEQWLACLAHNQEVEGSNPSSETIYDPIGSPLSPYFSTMVILNFTKKKLKKLSHKKLVNLVLEGADLVKQISANLDNANWIARNKQQTIDSMSREIDRLDKLSSDLDSTVNHKTRLLLAVAKS